MSDPNRQQSLMGTQEFESHPIVRGGRFGIVSGENPRFPAQQRGHDQMGAAIRQMGLRGESTSGKYDDHEPSWIVHNPTREQMEELGRRFGQESVVWGGQGGHELIYTNGEHQGRFRPSSGPIKTWPHNQPPDNYYTVIPGGSGGAAGYFQIPFDFEAAPQARVQPIDPQKIGKSISRQIDRYFEQLVKMREKESPLKKASYQQTTPHREPGIHEPPGSAPQHKEPGQHERPATAVQQESITVKSQVIPEGKRKKKMKTKREFQKALGAAIQKSLAKVAPPGHEEQVKALKPKVGVESAYKIAWASKNKEDAKKTEGGCDPVAAHLKARAAKSVKKDMVSAGGDVTKQEDFIDLANQADPEKRIKEVGKTKGRVIPSDKSSKVVEAKGSGGDVAKGKEPVKKEEIEKAFSSKPSGVPGAPKPPQAPGAKPSMHMAEPNPEENSVGGNMTGPSVKMAEKVEKAAPPMGMGKMPKDAVAHAALDSHKAAVKETVPAEAPQPKAVAKPPSEFDAKSFMPKAPVNPPAGGPQKVAGAVSPVKTHLQRLGKLPMASLGRVVGKSEEKDTKKIEALCKECGKVMDSMHKCG